MSKRKIKEKKSTAVPAEWLEGEAGVPGDETGAPIEVSPEAAEVMSQLQTELDEAVTARQRALADFQNFQRRAGENEQRARRTGASDVVRSVIPVLDQFDLALCQPIEQPEAGQLLEGMRLVRAELTKALEMHGVTKIDPAVGDEFDPHRHEAMMRQSADGVAGNHIVAVLQTGYAMGDLILRPAKVSVAPCENEE